MDVSIYRIDGASILGIGKEQIPIKDYKITSSMQGGTELEVVIKLDGKIMEFETSASSESLLQQNWKAKRGGS